MRSSRIKELSVSELVEDMDIYPRSSIDSKHIANMVCAMESGVTLPPIVADAKSKVVVDGLHRVRAYRRLRGNDFLVTVELVDYKSKAEMVFDAVSRNSSHGRKLDEKDRARSMHMLENHGWTEDRICVALKITPEKMTSYKVRVAHSRLPNQHQIPGTLNVSLKPSCIHLAGKTLTKKQTEAHNSAPGVSYCMIVRQLLSGLRGNLIDWNDETMVSLLKELAEELEHLLSSL